jgi:Flp pilus assembly protein TadG
MSTPLENPSARLRQFVEIGHASSPRRKAAVLLIVAVALPILIGFAGLVLDASLLLIDHRNLQNAADAAATAAAMTLYQGGTIGAATALATTCVQTDNGLANATVTVNSPPTSGSYAGTAGYVEVDVTRQTQTYLIQVLGAQSLQTLSVSSVAGAQASTAGAVVVTLDPNPPGISVDLAPVAPLTLSLPPILGGVQILGLGQLQVDGAVLDNNTWGGVTQNNQPAGTGPGPPYAASCTLSLTSLAAENVRVVGGVDNPSNYVNVKAGQSSPLLCNMLPVPDPYSTLPSPTTTADPVNVSATNYGGVEVVSLPLGLLGMTTLHPGVYDWIEVVSGSVVFEPGVYIIRNVNPITQVALNVVAGTVIANGVMFYITDSTNYSAITGAPDNADGNGTPPAPTVLTMVPSVVIASLLDSSYSALNSTTSPFYGLLFYQRRFDRRPIVLAAESLLLSGTLSGTVYAKYGQGIFAAEGGPYNLKFVTGSMLFLNALTCQLSPPQTELLPPAMDVYLVQ